MAAILRQLPECRMQAYFWVKTLHIVMMTAWMAAVFYLPRILVNMAETAGQPALQSRLGLMGRRLYRFGHVMFGLAFVFGVVLWLGYKWMPDFPTMVASGAAGWLHAKLTLVILLFVYYVVTGRWVKAAEAGKKLPSSRTLRWFNELPLLLFIAIVFLVLAKPF
jgi:putative membrane protein